MRRVGVFAKCVPAVLLPRLFGAFAPYKPVSVKPAARPFWVCGGGTTTNATQTHRPETDVPATAAAPVNVQGQGRNETLTKKRPRSTYFNWKLQIARGCLFMLRMIVGEGIQWRDAVIQLRIGMNLRRDRYAL